MLNAKGVIDVAEVDDEIMHMMVYAITHLIGMDAIAQFILEHYKLRKGPDGSALQRANK